MNNANGEQNSPDNTNTITEEDKIPGLRKVEELSPYAGETAIYTSLSAALVEPLAVKRLRLVSQNLKTIPLQIFNLTNLEELYLSDNQLVNLPSNFAQKFPRLQIIDLSNNRFQSFPAVLLQCTDLQSINFWSNTLNSLPDELVNLEKLQILSISGNRWRALPDVVFKMPNLKYLYIKDFKVNNLGKISQLKNLTRLALENIGLFSFPSEVLKLPKLEHLILRQNQINTLPSEIKVLDKLVYLNLSQNRLSNWIEPIGYLKKLVNLDLSYNPIQKFPDELFLDLPNLKALNVSYTALQSLPENIGQANHLIWLALNGTQIEKLPEEIQSCQRLQSLHLSTMPKLNVNQTLTQICRLNKLTNLSLIYWPVSGKGLNLPSEFIALKNLRKLDLKGTKLASPAQELAKFVQLPRLEALNLSKCGIKIAYPEFENLHSLKQLGLDIQNMPPGEVQKLPNLLASEVKLVEGSEYFDYR